MKHENKKIITGIDVGTTKIAVIIAEVNNDEITILGQGITPSFGLNRGEVVDITTLNNLDAEIYEFVVKKPSKVANSKIKDLDFPRSAIIGGVIKEGKGIIALGNYTILPDDRVVVCCLPEALEKVESLFS